MEIPIHVRDGDTTLLTFEGTGFASHIADSPETFYCSDVEAPLPCVQRIPFPGQVRAAVMISVMFIQFISL